MIPLRSKEGLNKKNFKKYIYYIFLAAVLIGIAIGIYFSTSAGENFIKNRLVSSLTRLTGQNVHIESLHIVFPAAPIP